MEDDQKQRTFEVVKLRIAFLQHITTLSGAAILIVLALMQRTENALVVSGLAFALPAFAVATFVSLMGMGFLTSLVERIDDPLPRSAGRLTTNIVSGVFGTGVLSVIVAAYRVPLGPFLIIMCGLLAVLVLLYIVILRITTKLRSRSIEARVNRETQDPDA